MARRKRKSTKRRRRVSGVGAMLNRKSPVVQLGSVLLGYLAADKINEPIDKVVPASLQTATDFKKYIPSGAKVALGAYLLMGKPLASGTPGLILSVVGGAIAGAGLKQALVKAGVVSGYQSVPVLGRRMGGYQAVPVIGKTPGQLQGYVPAGSGVAGLPAQLAGGYIPAGSGVMGGIGNSSGSGISDGSGYMN